MTTTTDAVPMPEVIAYADARISALQAELAAANERGDRWSITAQKVDHDLQKLRAERDALAARVKALENALEDAYLDDTNVDT